MWQEFKPPDGLAFVICFEKDGIIAAAKHDGLFAEWNLYRRNGDTFEEIAAAGVYCQMGGPNIPTGLGWAETQLAKGIQ